MADPSTPPFESRYPELTIPVGGWKSTIPAHLLDGADDQQRWIMEEISRNSAATEFACRGAVELSQHLRALNGKTYATEKGLAQAREEVNALKGQALVMTPFIKPMSMFAALWEYRAFKWVFVAGLVMFAGILYPIYLAHPFLEWVGLAVKALLAP